MFRKFPFKTKIILVQNIIILFVVILLGSIYYHKVLSTISESMLDDFKIVSDSVVDQLDNHFYVLDKTALQIAANPDIVNSFRQLVGSEGANYFEQELLKNAEIVELLNSYNFKRDGIKRICVYNQYHDFAYTATDITTKSGIDKWFQSDNFVEVQDYFENDNHHVYYSWSQDDILNDSGIAKKPYFSIIRQIKNHITNEKVYAYVEVQENVKWLNDVIKSINEDTYIALFYKDNLIYSNSVCEKEEGKYHTEKEFRNVKDTITQDIPVERSGYIAYTRELDNAPYQVMFLKEKGPEVVFFNQYNIVILIGFILILCIAVITEIFIVRKLSKPLEQLNESVKSMSLENPQLEVEQWKNNDEFVRIQYAFNAMIERMKSAMEREYASETNALKAQLFALQSQMNPHFLYNILAIISIESQMDGNDKIANMCTRLRRMLVYGSHMGDGYSEIKEEISYALDYMELMKVRYEDAFQYKIEGDENLYHTQIPKYIIQPICENSFKHSFKKIEPVWKNRIVVYEKDEKWILEVHDNGIGFSKEYLEQFSERVKNFSINQMRNNLEASTVEGMGIWNIYMRMMICYENDFIFQLYNDEEGAVVMIGGTLK